LIFYAFKFVRKWELQVSAVLWTFSNRLKVKRVGCNERSAPQSVLYHASIWEFEKKSIRSFGIAPDSLL
jgi:hypothetical protein